MMAIRIRIHSATALSELEVQLDGSDLGLDSPDLLALMAALDLSGERLVFLPGDGAAVARGLLELSNACDEQANDPAVSADERAHNRKASASLCTLWQAVLARDIS